MASCGSDCLNGTEREFEKVGTPLWVALGNKPEVIRTLNYHHKNN